MLISFGFLIVWHPGREGKDQDKSRERSGQEQHVERHMRRRYRDQTMFQGLSSILIGKHSDTRHLYNHTNVQP